MFERTCERGRRTLAQTCGLIFLASPKLSDANTVIVLCLGLLAVARGCAGPDESPERSGASDQPVPQGWLVVDADGTAEAEGAVVANEKGCEVNAPCWLVLDTGQTRVRVVYLEAEGGSTANVAAAKIGLAVQPGERVSVHGRFEESSVGPMISTCADDAYFIQPTPDRND